MRLVEGVEWGALCYYYPCIYSGVVTDRENSFDIKITIIFNIYQQLYV